MKNRSNKNKKKITKKVLFIIASILIILLSLITYLVIYIFTPRITIIGSSIEIIEVFSEYNDKGATGLIGFNKDWDVKTKGNVDTSKIGKYEVDYSTYIFNKKYTKKRIVKVVDTTIPDIVLNGEETVYVCKLKDYVEQGAYANDNYDGDITSNIITSLKDNKVTYEVSDMSNNKNSIYRTIIENDIEKPVINLSGSSNITIYKGDNYVESGYYAYDNCDGDITSNVKVTNNVDINNVGKYNVIYEVADNKGNSASITRVVNVIDRPIESGTNIYLTFDDGPSSITPSILDILNEEGVKATFFVINKDDSLNYILQREVNEGHTIALHSNSHNYKYIYSSEEAYFSDLEAINNKVINVTGVKTNIIRFPGGSSNTVSRFNPGIMTRLTTMVKERGYIYFDWNVDSDDAGNAKTSDEVYNNVISKLDKTNNVVLMHDFEGNNKTLNALRNIIKYGKDNGYIFKSITESTPSVTHGINN